MKTKQEAQQAADALCKQMKGHGWKTRVWKNSMDWHYQVESGNLFVSPWADNEYSAGLSTHLELLSWHVKPKAELIPSGTPTFWSDQKTYKDPNKAVKAQAKRARKFIDQYNLIVLDAEAALGTLFR